MLSGRGPPFAASTEALTSSVCGPTTILHLGMTNIFTVKPMDFGIFVTACDSPKACGGLRQSPIDIPVHGEVCGIDRTGRFSRMRSEGSRFTWGSGGEAVFAKFCVCVRNRSQPFATVRNRLREGRKALHSGERVRSGPESVSS